MIGMYSTVILIKKNIRDFVVHKLQRVQNLIFLVFTVEKINAEKILIVVYIFLHDEKLYSARIQPIRFEIKVMN